jgi:hypothetical protein
MSASPPRPNPVILRMGQGEDWARTVTFVSRATADDGSTVDTPISVSDPVMRVARAGYLAEILATLTDGAGLTVSGDDSNVVTMEIDSAVTGSFTPPDLQFDLYATVNSRIVCLIPDGRIRLDPRVGWPT